MQALYFYGVIIIIFRQEWDKPAKRKNLQAHQFERSAGFLLLIN
jgi:hypothetical protein